MDFAMVGPVILLGLGCLGCAIGCSIAGMASHGVMSVVEEGHGKFIALSAMPSSQAIYAFILMIMMKGALIGGSLSPLSGIAMGASVGAALMFNSIFQGKAIATAIQASAKQPAIFGKTVVAATIIETFALFVFVFALLLL
jgi:V/A-type H+-transporting ATPase subunit K